VHLRELCGVVAPPRQLAEAAHAEDQPEVVEADADADDAAAAAADEVAADAVPIAASLAA
jgi:hypothetical protein